MRATTDRFWYVVIAVTSLVAIAVVLFLVYGPRGASDSGVSAGVDGLDVSQLPAVNALLNGCSAILLLSAYVAIRRRRIDWHRSLVLAAFGTSVMFLASYLTYHAFKAGPQEYAGDLGWLYAPILLSHIVLAAAIVPLALLTLYRGWQAAAVRVAADPAASPHPRTRHRRLARVTLPIWLYVSVTGVVVFLMLYRG